MHKHQFRVRAKLSSPGKVILCGEHAVVYGQSALAMAINLRCTATISSKKCGQGQIGGIIFKGTVNCKINLNQINKQLPMVFEQYATIRECSKQQCKIQYKISKFMKETKLFFKNHSIFMIEIESQIPIGKCLGSSAAFNTILVACLFLIFNPQNENQQDFKDIKLDLQEVNRISKILEAVEHGTPSGIDNFISTFGGLVLYNNSKSPPFLMIKDEAVYNKLRDSIQLRLVDSGIQKNTRKAVEIVRQNYNKQEKLDREKVLQIGKISQQVFDLLKNDAPEDKWKPKLFEKLTKNHNLLKQLGVSVPEIEQIVKGNTIQGKRCAKITGAGMGGYVLVLETPGSKENKTKNTQILTKMDENGLMISIL